MLSRKFVIMSLLMALSGANAMACGKLVECFKSCFSCCSKSPEPAIIFRSAPTPVVTVSINNGDAVIQYAQAMHDLGIQVQPALLLPRLPEFHSEIPVRVPGSGHRSGQRDIEPDETPHPVVGHDDAMILPGSVPTTSEPIERKKELAPKQEKVCIPSRSLYKYNRSDDFFNYSLSVSPELLQVLHSSGKVSEKKRMKKAKRLAKRLGSAYENVEPKEGKAELIVFSK
jgi:hypothetical protein